MFIDSFSSKIKLYQQSWTTRFYNTDYESLAEVLDFLPALNWIAYYMKKISNLWADQSLKLKYDITVDVEDFHAEVLADFTLYQNYPNPFNPSTKIKFVIPKSSFVNLKVYNVLGKEVATLVNEERPAGNYEVEFNATDLSSGVYFHQLRVGDPSTSLPAGRQGSGQSFVENKKK